MSKCQEEQTKRAEKRGTVTPWNDNIVDLWTKYLPHLREEQFGEQFGDGKHVSISEIQSPTSTRPFEADPAYSACVGDFKEAIQKEAAKYASSPGDGDESKSHCPHGLVWVCCT